MRPGFEGLPKGAERWGDARWNRYHSEQADAIGCVYRPELVINGPLLIASAVSHTEGVMAGRPFAFLPWFEHRIVHPFYGYVERETGLRRYRKCYLFVAKKNAKTTSMGPLLLHHLVTDGQVGARVFSAAGSIEQASEVYDVAMPMVTDSPSLSKRLLVRDANRRIIFPATHSWYQVLSADVHTKHGKKPSCVHFDELHAQPDRYLWDVLTVGASAGWVDPALFATSTAGYDRNGICYEEWQYARRVKQDPSLDPELLVVIYEMPEDADWQDEKNWCLANPSMGTRADMMAGKATISVEDMRAEFRKAIEIPAKQNMFRMMRLNQWVSQELRFIPMERYDALCAPETLSGRPHYGGLDLSSTTDLTAYVRVAWDGPNLDVFGHYWVPGANIEDRERRDRAPYREWARQGFVTFTDGDIIDYPTVREYLRDTAKTDGRPQEIGFDPWNATQFCQIDLPDDGFTMVEVRQGYKTMSSPTKQLLELILAGNLRVNDPVLRWMADNTVVTIDPTNAIKPDKSKARQRIDGIVALIVALDRAARHIEPRRSVYEDHGIEYI